MAAKPASRDAYVTAASERFRLAHDGLGREIRRLFPEAEAVFEYGMPAWRIRRPAGAPAPETSGTVDPRFVFVGLVERSRGVTVHLWYPGDYFLFDRHGAALREAGFKVMRGCLSFERQGNFPTAALVRVLEDVRETDRVGGGRPTPAKRPTPASRGAKAGARRPKATKPKRAASAAEGTRKSRDPPTRRAKR